MKKHSLISILVVITFALFSTVGAQEIHPFGLTEFQLANGIEVCLKPTDFEDGEILIHLFGDGGFLLLPEHQRASAELSAAIAWESGTGKHSSDELCAMHYEHGIELRAHVGPYARSIEGSVPPAHLAILLECLHEQFTAPRFTTEALERVKEKARVSLDHRLTEGEEKLEHTARMISCCEARQLRPLTRQDIDVLDYKVAEAFYRDHFLNTQGLRIIIVGNFTVQEIRPLLEKWLGTIPRTTTDLQQTMTSQVTFPEGVIERRLTMAEVDEGQTRLTFNLRTSEGPVNIRLWELSTQVIETRLRQAFLREAGSTQAIDVALEFPLHPHTTPAWITLQFRCSPKQTEKLIEIAIHELRELQKEGATSDEVGTSFQLQCCNDEFWERNNRYWADLLVNTYQLHLNLEEFAGPKPASQASHEAINNFLRTCLDVWSYTIVTITP